LNHGDVKRSKIEVIAAKRPVKSAAADGIQKNGAMSI
jgi:hypothetical protein